MPSDEMGRSRVPDEDILLSLGIEPGDVVVAEPLNGGLTSARLVRLRLRHSTPYGAPGWATRVLKQVAAGKSWLVEPDEAWRVPGVRLWSAGLLKTLPASIATGLEAWALVEGKSARGALLMRDLRGRLWQVPQRKPPSALTQDLRALLDRLAQMHARYWGDERLCDRALGLLPARSALLLMSPDRLERRLAVGDETPYLRVATEGWEAFFNLANPEDTAVLLAVLAQPEPWLRVIGALPWTLVHGDVWVPNLGWLPATGNAPRRGRRALLLDWELATVGPATYDPLWLCGTWHTLNPVQVLAAYRARLQRHLAARGHSMGGEVWRALADTSYLRTALTCGEAFGWSAERARGAERRRAEARARWWARRGALAAQRLVAGTQGD
jgi:hypothetical protein